MKQESVHELHFIFPSFIVVRTMQLPSRFQAIASAFDVDNILCSL